MALSERKEIIPVGGLDTFTAERVLDPSTGRVLELENAYFARANEVVKRNGTAPLSASVAPSGTLPNAWQLATHKGALVSLGQVGAHPLATWSPSAGRWAYAPNEVLRGPISVNKLPYPGEGNGGYNADVAATPSYFGVGFVNQPGSAFSANNYIQQVVDVATSKVIYSYTSTLSASAYMGHVRAVGTSWFVHCWLIPGTGGSVIFGRWDIANIATSGTPTQVTAATGQSFGTWTDLDLQVTGPDEVTAIWVRNDNKVMFSKFTVSTATASTAAQLKDSAGVGIVGKTASFVKQTVAMASQVVLVLDTATGLRGHVYGSGMSSNATTSTTIDAGATNTSQTSTMTAYSTSSTDYAVLYENPGATAVQVTVRAAKVVAGVPTLAASFQSGAIASRVALLADGDYYVVLYYPSATQPAFFLVRATSDPTANLLPPPVARFSTWNAWLGNGLFAATVSDLATIGNDVISATSERVRLESAGGVVTYDFGVALRRIVCNDATAGPPHEAADNLFIPGGVLSAFDGVELREAAWSVYPELISAAYSNPPGGLVAGQTYKWAGVFRWIDASGRVHRSAVSAVLTGTVSAGNSAATITYTTPRLSSGAGGIFELYRQPALGGAYYKVSSRTIDKSVVTSTILDTTSDAALVAGELLYSQPGQSGSVLADQPPPPAVAVTAWQQRVWAISAERRTELWFTAEIVDGLAPKWNEALVIDMDDEYGDITGIAPMDDKLVILKANAVYVLSGPGPDATGAGSFQHPALVSPADGMAASDIRSIVAYPDGVMFRSGRGITALTRGLTTEYIGKDVQKQTASGFTPVSAFVVPSLTQVRFYSAEGTTLVYDYTVKQWSTFTGQAATSATLWGNSPVYVTGNTVLVETPGLYSENGANITMRVTFPWLKMSGFRGFGRLYEFQGVGELVESHVLDVTTAYNDDPTDTVVKSVAPDVNWNWAVLDDRQKVSTARVTLAETSGAAGFKVSALVAWIGAKPGLNRINPAQRAQ